MFTPLQSGATSDIAAQLAAAPILNEEDPTALFRLALKFHGMRMRN